MKKIWLALAMVMPCLGFEWEQLEIEKVKYVPLSQVAQFYRFEKPVVSDDKVTLRHADITAIFEINARNASFNKVNFSLEEKLVRRNGFCYLSESDLLHLVEPVLRPSKVKALAHFDTVIFDLDFQQELPEQKLLITELQSTLQKRNFMVFTFGHDGKPSLDWAKFQELAKTGDAIVIQLAVRDGERIAIKSHAFGASPGAGLALSTSLHWNIMRQLNDNPGLATIEDDRISVGQVNGFEKIDVPACRLELTYNFSTNSTVANFHRTVANSVANAISFTSKAGRARQEAAQGNGEK
jgi:hypothetical protein